MKKSDSKLIDKFGFRANVGIILINKFGKVLWARRFGEDSWQFPQGGMSTPSAGLVNQVGGKRHGQSMSMLGSATTSGLSVHR